MNCVRCGYLLWNLPDSRCPECGLGFEVTDYQFPRGSVAFLCRECGESYLGNDERGLPAPQRFCCGKCNAHLDAATMLVKPLVEDVRGEPIRMGTPWEQRRQVGYFRGFLDGISRLAIQPSDYFRRSCAAGDHGEVMFSVVCAYVGVAFLVATIVILQSGGLLAWLPNVRALIGPRFVFLTLGLVPLLQVGWNYFYGLLIQAVLAILGRSGSEYESSVRAVAFGSAVLPAVLLLPPVGLLWYIKVVSSGIEHLHRTTHHQALIATMIPVLAAGNLVLIIGYAFFG